MKNWKKYLIGLALVVPLSGFALHQLGNCGCELGGDCPCSACDCGK